MSECNKTSDVESISMLIERIMETMRKKIDDLQNELETGIDEEFLAEAIEEYCEWKDEVQSAVFKAKRLFHVETKVLSAKDEDKGKGNFTVRLPKLNLPVFSGDYLEWQLFYDSFTISVHSRDEIPPIDKFNYLRSQLRGSALDVVKGFSLSAENYEAAFSLLCDRFGKKDAIIRAHIKALLNLPVVENNNLKSLSDFITTVEISVRSLNSLGISNEQYSCFLTQIVLFRLPDGITQEFARFDRTGTANICELLKFLNDELAVQRSCKEYCTPEKRRVFESKHLCMQYLLSTKRHALFAMMTIGLTSALNSSAWTWIRREIW